MQRVEAYAERENRVRGESQMKGERGIKEERRRVFRRWRSADCRAMAVNA